MSPLSAGHSSHILPATTVTFLRVRPTSELNLRNTNIYIYKFNCDCAQQGSGGRCLALLLWPNFSCPVPLVLRFHCRVIMVTTKTTTTTTYPPTHNHFYSHYSSTLQACVSAFSPKANEKCPSANPLLLISWSSTAPELRSEPQDSSGISVMCVHFNWIYIIITNGIITTTTV